MSELIFIFVAITAAVHFGFMYKEMCGWEKLAQDVAGISETEAKATKAIGFNQGLYNGFFAVGLTATLLKWPPNMHIETLQVFILLCVVVAGIVGAITLPLKRVVFLAAQSGPAIIALALIWIERM